MARRYGRAYPHRGLGVNGQPTEAMEAKWLSEWVMLHPVLGDTMFHIPNEGKRRAWGSLLPTRLIRPGVSDYFIPVPRGLYHGMFLELKAIGGRITPDQTAWLERMLAYGYWCEVAFGFVEAKQQLSAYLDMPTMLRA